MSEKLFIKVSGSVSKYQANIIKDYADKKGMPINRVVSALIDNAITEGIPLDYDLELPDEDHCEGHIYGNEGGKILNFLKTTNARLGVDQLMTLRHDIGVYDKRAILHVLSDLIRVKILEQLPASNLFYEYPDDYFQYRIKADKKHDTKRKRVKNANKYEEYLKLKKVYESEA